MSYEHHHTKLMPRGRKIIIVDGNDGPLTESIILALTLDVFILLLV